MKKEKDLTIETIRGIALILMVMGHVIGNETEGMRVADGSGWHYIYYSLMYIRMPLFTAISGYVYSMRPVSGGNSGRLTKFYSGKARRILMPLAVVGTIQYLFQCFTPYVNTPRDITEIWEIYVFPYSHFWYLQALFIIFVFVGILDYFNLLNKIHFWAGLLIISVIVQQTYYAPEFFSLERAHYLLPFFLLGCGVRRFEKTLLYNKFIISAIAVVFICCITLQQLVWYDVIELKVHRSSILGMIAGITSSALMLKIRFKSGFLSTIGYYSYGVYLLHLFGSASSRIFLKIISLDQYKIFVFIIGLSFGILVPIIMEKVIMRYKYAKLLVLGLRKK